MKGRKLKILGVGSSEHARGQTWYRLQAPFNCLEAFRVAETSIYVIGDDRDLEGLLKAAFSCDLVIFQNAWHPSVLKIMRALQNEGVAVALDIDDFNILTSADNYAYLTWGRREGVCRLPDGRPYHQWKDGGAYRWKDGERVVFDLAKNKERARFWLAALRVPDVLICATARLAARIQRFKGWRLNGPDHREVPVMVMPNMMDPTQWPRVTARGRSPHVRILWQGGSSHFGDLISIKPVLREILYKFPQARLVMMGTPFAHFYEGLPEKQVEIVESEKDDQGYIDRLVELQADIGIAPLLPTVFNECKSPVKFEQYAMLGIPTVASDWPPYSDVISMEGRGKGWTGLLVGQPIEWEKALTMLIQSDEMRATIGRNARMWVETHLSNRDPANARNLIELYGGIRDLRRAAAGVCG